MKKISVSIGGIGSAKCTNIFTQPYKAINITDGLSGVISLIGTKIGAVVWRSHWLSNKGYLRGGSSGELIWRLICGLKSSYQYFLSYLKSLTSLKGLSAINLSWLRSIKRHNKPLSSSLSSLVAYPLLAFVIITLAACGGGGGGGGTSGVDVDVNNNGLIEIHTAAQLKLIHKDLNGASLDGNSFGCPSAGCHGYELMANISLAAAGSWDPIGSCTADNTCKESFNATFDGNGFTISNIRIELNTTTNGVGFFAAISEDSVLRNVVLSDVNISLSGSSGTTYTDVGGLVGYADPEASIDNSDVVNIVIGKTPSVKEILPGRLVGDRGGNNPDNGGGTNIVVENIPDVNDQNGDDKSGANQGGDDKGGANQGGDDKDGANQGGDDKDGANQGGDDKGDANQGGDGPSVDKDGDGLIEIYTAAQLNLIRANLTGESLNGNSTGCPSGGCRGYELMANISLAEAGNWVPIGSCPSAGTCKDSAFDATFEGNGYTISNLTIIRIILKINNQLTFTGIGFFAGISADSQLRNLVLRNVNISLNNPAPLYYGIGGLVGDAGNGLIVNSSVVNIVIGVTSSVDSVGGLVGRGQGTRITSSFALVDSINITGSNVGGLVGLSEGATISSSFTVVDSINITGSNVGGLVGRGTMGTTISSSFAVMDSIKGTSAVGGLVGLSKGATISSSFAVVDSISGSASGGLVGFVSLSKGATISSSFAVVNSISGSASGGLVGLDLGATINSSYARGTTDSGEIQTANALRSGTADSVIYAAWAKAWCDPSSGEFTTNSTSDLAIMPNATTNLAWNFGNSTQYPALNCLTENISLANQRRTAANVLGGKLLLDGITPARLNQ